jgi:uncharacterized membrane protein
MKPTTTRLQWLLLQLTRRLWVRATAFSLLGVATALVAVLAKRYIPADIPTKIGADAVDNLLNIIAASMLSVTIFSLSTLVSALGSATSNVTPRATRLLSEDNTAQNALATFLGSFLYSLVGIIALQTGLYGDTGRVVLYVVTLVVIAVIVATLLRWIDYVSRLGRVGQTTRRVEEAANSAMRHRRDNPCLGGQPLAPGERPSQPWVPVHAQEIGYVEHIDMAALDAACDSGARSIFVCTLPGAYVDGGRPLARVVGPCSESDQASIRDAFTIGDERSFDQDPRFGLSVLAEIASRALSPAVNDPGTAIDVLGRAARVLATWTQPASDDAGEIRYPCVHVPGIPPDDLFDDVFTPIARDGAAIIEVGLRLQKALRMLARTGDARYRAASLRHSALALSRAEQALTLEDDRRRVRESAARVGIPLE